MQQTLQKTIQSRFHKTVARTQFNPSPVSRASMLSAILVSSTPAPYGLRTGASWQRVCRLPQSQSTLGPNVDLENAVQGMTAPRPPYSLAIDLSSCRPSLYLFVPRNSRHCCLIAPHLSMIFAFHNAATIRIAKPT